MLHFYSPCFLDSSGFIFCLLLALCLLRCNVCPSSCIWSFLSALCACQVAIISLCTWILPVFPYPSILLNHVPLWALVLLHSHHSFIFAFPSVIPLLTSCLAWAYTFVHSTLLSLILRLERWYKCTASTRLILPQEGSILPNVVAETCSTLAWTTESEVALDTIVQKPSLLSAPTKNDSE